MGKKKFGRVGASVLHLVICLVIAAAVVAVFWGVWYPKGMTFVAGAFELLMIIIGVDVVVGPVLTFILFVPGKKGLYFDLTMIALLQLAALIYGSYVMLQTRPVFLVAMSDKLQLVSANEIDDHELAKASDPKFGHRSWWGPVLVGSKDPEDPERLMELVASVLSGGPEIDRRPEFYVPYEIMASVLVDRSKRLSSWARTSDEKIKKALNWTQLKGMAQESIAVVPIAGRNGTYAMLVDATSYEILRAFDFHPGALPVQNKPSQSEPSFWSIPNYLGTP